MKSQAVKSLAEPSEDLERCPVCKSKSPRIYVHGHYQCILCGVNIDPCCGGVVSER